MAAHAISPFFFANAGTILRRENFMKRRLYSAEVFVFVDREYVDEELIKMCIRDRYYGYGGRDV